MEHYVALEYLHLTQVWERWEPEGIPTNAHSRDKDHSVDKRSRFRRIK